PDGDTGTNLFLTVQAIADELAESPATDLPAIMAVVTRGSLMGARGNSGVILSQIVRGACESIATATAFDAAAVRDALREASAAAYRAVRQPVEGTMLSVIRAMSEAAADTPDGISLPALLTVVSTAGAEAVERTVDQLEALRRAGVVDAGGYGLLVLFRGGVAGFMRAQTGSAAAAAVTADGSDRRRGRASRHIEGIPPDALEESKYRYCTSFLLLGESLDGDDLERYVNTQGDCALVVGGPDMLKIHVHTDHPGAVLSYASAHGTIDDVEVADMREQTAARERRLRLDRRVAVVAVAAGEGNKTLFRELGCEAIVDGGQSMNPSAAQLVEAVDALDAAEVVILPNNKNVVLTAEQAAAMCDRNVVVVPSTSMPAGMAAMVQFDRETDAAANAVGMDEALRRVQTAEITHAVRDSEIDGVAVRQGEVMGLVDGRLVASGVDLCDVFDRVVRHLREHAAEVVTVLTALNGSGCTVADLKQTAADACPDCEFLFQEGGQPLYPILMGAE
ncbi:MAG TPA: DAK2 domain-containing protein, partial [Thermoleophilia bacterium]|nr:DAK2 domain-containing protein [Thermoleophilia bacterium]